MVMQALASDNKSADQVMHNEGVFARLRQKSTQLHSLLAHEWGLLSGFVVALFLFLVLFSYDPNDAGFFSSGSARVIHNWGDATGAWLASFLLFLFGVFAYVVPFGVALVSWVAFRIRVMKSEIDQRQLIISGSSLVLLLASGAALATLYLDGQSWFVLLPYSGGGMTGYALSYFFVSIVDRLASTLLFLLAFFVSFSWIIGVSWLQIIDVTGELLWLAWRWIQRSWHEEWKPLLLRTRDWLVEKYKLWQSGDSIGITPEALRSWTRERWMDAVRLARQKLHSDKGVLHRPVGESFHITEIETLEEAKPDLAMTTPITQNVVSTTVAPLALVLPIQNSELKTEALIKIPPTEKPPTVSDEPVAMLEPNFSNETVLQSVLDHTQKTQTIAAHHTIEHELGAMDKLVDDVSDHNHQAHSDYVHTIDEPKPIIDAVSSIIEPIKPVIESIQLATTADQTTKSSALPSLELLNAIPENKTSLESEVLQGMGVLLEQSLKEYNIKAEVVDIIPGPVVTLFELQPAPGVKVGSITNLVKDLARSMSVMAVRVVDVIPGKTVIGIEIPNPIQAAISFRELLGSEVYQNTDMILPIVLGKDTAGRPTVADLAKMPHALVAGQTGSGKSVGVNAMIVSLLYHATADQVKFIMIDPKMLELSVYNDIPHLLSPVVTDMSEAANALRWCVVEMDRRYQLMSKLGVRNIAGFNEKVQEAIDAGKPIIDPTAAMPAMSTFDMAPPMPTLVPLPYIVVIVDEFADLFMVVGKKIEELIARLAQKARAAGIHLVLATQRPSVDVVTGLIKANIPARISFKVASKVDSRTILDQMGADQLLGRGDMLYLGNGMGTPQRVHGPFVSDDEVHRVVSFLKTQGTPDYIALDPATALGAGTSSTLTGLFDDEAGGAERDAYYDEAVKVVLETRKVSASSLQRRFSIGYNRAARIVDAMEAAGLISAQQNNGNREVLMPE
jgi:S-DNA-T family DNA segregation ATPase FtsK/SpoIIIE